MGDKKGGKPGIIGANIILVCPANYHWYWAVSDRTACEKTDKIYEAVDSQKTIIQTKKNHTQISNFERLNAFFRADKHSKYDIFLSGGNRIQNA